MAKEQKRRGSGSIMRFIALAVVVLAVNIYFKLSKVDLALEKEIEVITFSNEIEQELTPFKELIGSDYNGYRGHIYRVLTYSNHILQGDKSQFAVTAKALVYHDIGLWTDKKLAYLEPSSSRAKDAYTSTLNSEQLQLLHDVIYWHHKITPFEGAHADVVNAVRRADWIDATMGTVHQGMPKSHIKKVYEAIPVDGFYDTLRDMGPRLYGSDVIKIVTEMVSILKW